MSERDPRPGRPIPAWLVRVIAVPAWTVLTIASVVVAVDVGLLPEITSGDVGPALGARDAELPRPAGSSPLPPAEPPANRGMTRSAPADVAIPALDIRSPLVRLALHEDTGALEVPSDHALAGWYAGGPSPGEANGPPAVIVGHVDSLTGPAVFFRLREIEQDTEIHVTREDGTTAVFRVVDAHQYPKDALPVADVYAHRQPAELVLITCTGRFDERSRSYLDNFVVTARLDPAASGLPT